MRVWLLPRVCQRHRRGCRAEMCRRTAAAVTFDIALDRGESEGVGILFRRILVYFSSSRVAGSVAERYFIELRSSCSCCPSVVRCQLVTRASFGACLERRSSLSTPSPPATPCSPPFITATLSLMFHLVNGGTAERRSDESNQTTPHDGTDGADTPTTTARAGCASGTPRRTTPSAR